MFKIFCDLHINILLMGISIFFKIIYKTLLCFYSYNLISFYLYVRYNGSKPALTTIGVMKCTYSVLYSLKRANGIK